MSAECRIRQLPPKTSLTCPLMTAFDNVKMTVYRTVLVNVLMTVLARRKMWGFRSLYVYSKMKKLPLLHPVLRTYHPQLIPEQSNERLLVVVVVVVDVVVAHPIVCVVVVVAVVLVAAFVVVADDGDIVVALVDVVVVDDAVPSRLLFVAAVVPIQYFVVGSTVCLGVVPVVPMPLVVVLLVVADGCISC